MEEGKKSQEAPQPPREWVVHRDDRLREGHVIPGAYPGSLVDRRLMEEQAPAKLAQPGEVES